MISINGSQADKNTLIAAFQNPGIEIKIIDQMYLSQTTYDYLSIEQLRFEMNLRKAIIQASNDLYHSRFSFRTFRESICNSTYWERTEEGGFRLKPDTKPSEAIRDIYKNSRDYGTECATAIVIIYYKALLELLPEELFNKLFADAYLMNWQHLDSDLGIRTEKDLPDYFPGDCRYFKNPDVDPLTPEWQGENVIDLGDGLYYGHGIGIRTAEQMIEVLNRQRKKDAQTSAYLLNTSTRLNFKYLADQYLQSTAQASAPSRAVPWECPGMPCFTLLQQN